MFYTNINQLPTEPDEYFIHYHNHWFNGIHRSTADLHSALAELRLAFKKYPDRGSRVLAIADIIKRGLNHFSATDEPEFQDNKDNFVNEVEQALF